MLKVWADAFYLLGQENNNLKYDEEFRKETEEAVREIEEYQKEEKGHPELENPITIEEVIKQ